MIAQRPPADYGAPVPPELRGEETHGQHCPPASQHSLYAGL